MNAGSFFDASFVVFIGFLVFVGLVLKYGYYKAVGAIDNEIQKIRVTLEQAAENLKAAEDRVGQEQRAEKQLVKDIEDLQSATDRRIKELRHLMSAEINSILTNKQHITESTIDMLRHTTILELREVLTAQAVQTLTTVISTMTNHETHEYLNSQAIDKLKAILLIESNENGGSPKQAIA